MRPLFDFFSGYKTYILGIVAIVSGLGTMLLSGGDFVELQTGWTQIMAGFGMIFIRSGVKTDVAQVKTEVKDANSSIVQSLKADKGDLTQR